MRSVADIKNIYIDQSLAESALASEVRSRFSGHIEYISDSRSMIESYQQKGNLVEKDTLLIYPFPGRFMSSCPGSDGMVCCQYFVINFGVGCLFDCHYCYLQNFLNNPLMTIFGNLEDLFTELEKKTRNKKFHYRIGTGEYTDSLALDPLTGLSSLLINHFAGLENATLELKTKSSNVEQLLDLNHKGNTVMAWSVNPRRIVEAVEDGTASLEERLQAAEKVQRAGYKLAFHLDPLIHYDNWEAEYHDLIDEITDRINPDRIAWISMGSFRYSAGQKEIMQGRFPEDWLTRAEMIQGPDGKYRYFKTIRENMYASIRNKIQKKDPKLFLYMCMETKLMWERVYNTVPDSARNLDSLFEQRRQFINSLLQPAG